MDNNRALIASEFANSFNRKWREGIESEILQMCFDAADSYMSFDAQQKSSQIAANDIWLMVVPNIPTVITVNVIAIDSNTITLTGADLDLPIGVPSARYSLNDIRLIQKL